MKTYRYIGKEYTRVQKTRSSERFKVEEGDTFESEINYPSYSLFIEEVKDGKKQEAPEEAKSEEEKELEALRAEYQSLHPEGKEVANSKKNDAERIKGKIEEFETEETEEAQPEEEKE